MRNCVKHRFSEFSSSNSFKKAKPITKHDMKTYKDMLNTQSMIMQWVPNQLVVHQQKIYFHFLVIFNFMW